MVVETNAEADAEVEIGWLGLWACLLELLLAGWLAGNKIKGQGEGDEYSGHINTLLSDLMLIQVERIRSLRTECVTSISKYLHGGARLSSPSRSHAYLQPSAISPYVISQ